MKKTSFTLLIAILIVSVLVPRTAVAAEQHFSDVKKGDAHYDGVHWLTTKGIDGYEDGSFKPYNSLTRGQAAKIFVLALDLKLPDKQVVEERFTDVKVSHTHAKYIAAVSEAEILMGKNGEFGPEKDLTREQMASTLVRALDLKSSGTQVDINLENVDEAHQENVQILADLEVTDKLNDFEPAKATKRGQFASFLYRAVEPESDQPAPEPDPGEDPIKITKQNYDYDFNTMIKKQMSMTTLPQTSANGSWYDASEGVAAYYLNPNNFDEDTDGFYQFLKLSGTSGISAKELNTSILNGKGILDGKGSTFMEASKQNRVNDIYLISHAMLETGNGTSELATGVEVGLDKDKKPVQVTKKNRDTLTDIKMTYNMYGIGAIDEGALKYGSERAYQEEWFTPESAIIGGAEFIAGNYIGAGQDTLYKMKWNPDNPATHQYATDAGWAVKQTERIKDMFEQYKQVDGYVMQFEVPVFNNQPKRSVLPTGIDQFNVDTKDASVGKKVLVTGDNVNFREGPTTQFTAIAQLPRETKVTIIGKNQKWYKVKAGNKEGWIIEDYLDVNKKETKAATLDKSSVKEDPSPDFIVEHHDIRLP